MYNLGLVLIRRLVEDQKPLAWHKAKLSKALFKGLEQPVFAWVDDFVKQHHKMPTIGTVEAGFPEVKEVSAPEPASYYLDLTLNRFAYERIGEANIESQAVLKNDKSAVLKAEDLLREALHSIAKQRSRLQVMEVTKELPKLVLNTYHGLTGFPVTAEFGWPYLDKLCGGVVSGDVISFVGRPQQGKTFKMLWSAMHNWRLGKKVLFASMEMAALAVGQRFAAMHAGTNLTQLKTGAYSYIVYPKFETAMLALAQQPTELLIVDGNLTLYTDQLYELAALYGCDMVYVDGAYLMKHPNARLDRYTKVAENIEAMKQNTTALEIPTVASWQFAKTASKKDPKKGEKITYDDIGYSDAIAQISSVVLGLLQEEGVESAIRKLVDVLKGRGGEVGRFEINWNFNVMDFSQLGAPAEVDHGDKLTEPHIVMPLPEGDLGDI